MTAGYVLPTPTDYVSCSWQCHRDRNPPSSEPGTDYGCAYGSPVIAVFGGYVNDVKTSNSGAMGRYVAIALDDGRVTRTLHMSSVWVSIGQRVEIGNQVGLSGASGYNSDWYYGPHAHQTLWPGAAWAQPTIDFALYVGGGSTPDPDFSLEDEMIRIQSENRGIALIGPGYFRGLTSDEEVQNSDALIARHVSGNDRQFDLWRSMATTGAVTPPAISADTVKQIADAIAAEVEIPPVTVDYAAIADAVNDDAAARMKE